jgi:hypothetical protein
MKTMDDIIKMERFIYSQIKFNRLSYYELLRYLEFLESLNMHEYKDEDIQRYFDCLEELYGDGEVAFPSIRKGVKGIQKLKFPPLNNN